MKLPRTIAEAQAPLPKTRPHSRNQSVSKSSDAPPDKKKMADSATVSWRDDN